MLVSVHACLRSLRFSLWISIICPPLSCSFNCYVLVRHAQSIYDEDSGLMPWRVPPFGMDPSLIHCTMMACHYMLRKKGFSAGKVTLLTVLVHWELCRYDHHHTLIMIG